METSLAELLQEVERRLSLKMSVCRPARIIAYDAEAHTVEVQPLFQTVYRDSMGEVQRQDPAAITVHVWRWIFGGFELVFPLVPGESVGLIVADRALGALLAVQPADDAHPLAPVDPLLSRAHDLADGIAIPGLLASSAGATSEDPIVLRHLSGLIEVSVYPDGRILFGSGGEADQAGVRGDVLAGYLSSQRTWLSTLTLPVALGVAGPPASPPPPIPADLLSALLKLR